MHSLEPGTLLTCLSDDHADEPFNHEIEAGDLVVVVWQNNTRSAGHTTFLSLTQGVFYRTDYRINSPYDRMEDAYEVFEP